VRFQLLASAFASDNIATRGVQADLNGRLWFTDPNGLEPNASGTPDAGTRKIFIGIDASAVAGQSQPIYYPPAAGGAGLPATAGCNLYAFGSGTFYEESERINPLTPGGTAFVPSLYFAANDKTKDEEKIDSTKVLRIPIMNINRPERCDAESVTPCTLTNDVRDFGATLSPLSQMTGAPLLLIDQTGLGQNVGIFVIYDPTVGCYGASYAVTVRWQTDSCEAPLIVREGTSNAIPSETTGAIVVAKYAGEGAASGLTAVGRLVFTGIAGLGIDGKADLYGISETSAFGKPTKFRPVWWKELK
jgi:hypothetical protein